MSLVGLTYLQVKEVVETRPLPRPGRRLVLEEGAPGRTLGNIASPLCPLWDLLL